MKQNTVLLVVFLLCWAVLGTIIYFFINTKIGLSIILVPLFFVATSHLLGTKKQWLKDEWVQLSKSFFALQQAKKSGRVSISAIDTLLASFQKVGVEYIKYALGRLFFAIAFFVFLLVLVVQNIYPQLVIGYFILLFIGHAIKKNIKSKSAKTDEKKIGKNYDTDPEITLLKPGSNETQKFLHVWSHVWSQIIKLIQMAILFLAFCRIWDISLIKF